MSVAEYIAHQQNIKNLNNNPPECWAIVANSVYAQAEQASVVAIFDTEAQARAYVNASLLPPDWPNERVLSGWYVEASDFDYCKSGEGFLDECLLGAAEAFLSALAIQARKSAEMLTD